MKRLFIIGARGFGREVFDLARQCYGFGREFEISGFLDDKASALAGFSRYPPVVSSVEAFHPGPDDRFVCALGDAKYKKIYIDMMVAKGGAFVSLVHPTAIVSPAVTIPQGVIIQAYAFVSCDVTIGDFVTIQPFCTIGHDARIGCYAHLNAYAFMGGFAEVEEGVTLHTGAKVLPNKSVGAWATVGAGSVVVRNVKAGQTVFGMPAMALVF